MVVPAQQDQTAAPPQAPTRQLKYGPVIAGVASLGGGLVAVVLALALACFNAIQQEQASWQRYLQQQSHVAALMRLATTDLPAVASANTAQAEANTAVIEAHLAALALLRPEDLATLNPLRESVARYKAQRAAAAPQAMANSTTNAEAQHAQTLLESLSAQHHTQAALTAKQAQTQALKYGLLSLLLALCGLLGGFFSLLTSWRHCINNQAVSQQFQRETSHYAQQLEAALREKKLTDERLAYALNSNGDGIWDWDLVTNRVYRSQRLKAMLGYSDEEISESLDEWSSRVHPDDLAHILSEVKANITGKTQDYACEHRMRSKDGGYQWILDRGQVVDRDAAGKALRMVGTYTDISAQKIATRTLEAALRESAALLATLNMHAIISVADRCGIITEVNQAFCQISGYPRDELIGQNHRIVNSGTHPKTFWVAMWRDIANGKPWRNTVCNRAKNGSLYWVDTFIAPFIDEHGQIEKYISIRTNITASQQQAAKLRAARDQLSKAAEVAKMGIWLWDIPSGALEWNPRMHEIYQSPEAIIHSGAYYDFWRSCLHPEDLASTEAALQAAIAGTGSYNPTFRIVTANGDTHYIQAAGFVERDAQGQALQMMGINLDVTEQRSVEAVLRSAKQAADEASKAKSDFLANMSHELRTPMNAILGMLALLNKTELSLRQADYTSKTESAARSLLGLLNDILDLSKTEAGKMTLDPQPFALSALLRDLSVILAANVSNKPVEVLFDVQPDVPQHLLGDAMRLQQVLVNLGGNAIKFTAKGEVIISIRVQEWVEGDAVLAFAVRDTGIGIAPENHAKIFSGFTQAEASTSRRFGGTGLGIAISQRLVALMGGQLQLQSALGEGSCFYFSTRLPLAPAPTVATPLTNALATPARRWRVLVVDDNPTTLAVIGRMTESFGWQADLAQSGAQALDFIQTQAAQGEAYQAVFMDWQMPGMDGWETSRQIRKRIPTHNAPIVIMITAYDREMLAQRSETEQVLIDGFLVKPITASMLLDAVLDARAEQGLSQPCRVDPPTEARLQGVRILLVEDNLTNQQVACELLAAEGAEVSIANHGKEALDLLTSALAQHPLPPFDVVLMDVQMPVMDGFTATTQIRQNLQLTALPIIAMTANAMASDREACLQAGMNDHIGKPFNLNHLVKVLQQYTSQPHKPAQATAPPASPLAPDLAQLIAAAGLNSHLAIERLSGNTELYIRLLPRFLNQALALSAELQGALARQDLAQIGMALHSFKGVSATMGQDHLAALTGRIDAELKRQDSVQAYSTGVAELCAAVEEATPALLALLKKLQAPMH